MKSTNLESYEQYVRVAINISHYKSYLQVFVKIRELERIAAKNITLIGVCITIDSTATEALIKMAEL